MKSGKRYIILWFLITVSSLQAQTDLTRNAYSIVQEATTEMICNSPTSALRKESFTITILNEKGQKAASFYCMCDKFMSLRKFTGEFLNANGQVIRKIKKSDLKMSEYSSGLTSDDYMYYYEYTPSSYPITIRYEWEVKYKDGIISYPTFFPQNDYNQSVLKATYRLQTPASSNACRYFPLNIKAQVTQSKTLQGNFITETSVDSIPAMEYEPFGPSLSEILPRIYFSPKQFTFDGTQGDLSTWKSYGEWQYHLLTGRDLLSESLKAKLHEMTASCSTAREKVQAVYNYLASTTRYVSIQLGIGGLQPITASEVCRVGFGDCKGLSNYTCAMLAELGISSTYTIISTDNKRLLPDFSSANQTNHVILQVPLPEDTLWLECTAPQLPFGYIHKDIAGHDALLIGPQGGTLCRLPSYPDSLNRQTIQAQIVLSPTGEARIDACRTSKLFQYEDDATILSLEPTRQKDFLRSDINLGYANISNIQINENKKANPEIVIRYHIDSQQYGNKTGNRLFIPVNVFRKGFSIPHIQQRKQDIHINYGYLDTDSICVQIPDGYNLESIPNTYDIDEHFGAFHTSIKVKDKNIYITHRLWMHQGVYPKESYQEFINFRKKVAGQYNEKIILKKE